MLALITRRCLTILPTLFGVSLVTFIIFHFVGGDPALVFAGKNADPAWVSSLRHELGLDRPVWAQYGFYLRQMLTWDWGTSWSTRESVGCLVWQGLGPSLALTVPAFMLSALTALFVAMMASLLSPLWNRALTFICWASMSLSFLVYIIYFQQFFTVKHSLFPVYGWQPEHPWPYLALPIFIYTLVHLAPKILLFRAALQEEFRHDYVRTALAKGLSLSRVLTHHILKNAARPMITLLTTQLPALITGSLLLEAYFGIPGLGGLLIKAIQTSDFPVIKALTLMGTWAYLIANLLNDVLNLWLDSRSES